MEPFSVLAGLGIGGLLAWLFQFIYKTSTSITITDVQCKASDTKIDVTFEVAPVGAEVSDILYAMYDSNVTSMPTPDQAQSAGSTSSPVELDYDPSSCADTIVLFAVSPGAGTSAAIPCVSSTCSSTETKSEGSSVLP